MARKLPPLNWVRSFEAAARHLSFTATGEELHLTQAAVSQHIKSLEQYLGQPLFIRMARSLKLTDQGRAYQRRIEPLLGRIADDTEEIFGSRKANQITVRATAAFSVLWLAPRLGRFLDAHPDLHVRIFNPIWSLQEMEEGADFEIRYGSGRQGDQRAHQLTTERLFPVRSPRHTPMDTADVESILCSAPLIDVIGYRDGWPDWISAAGITSMDGYRNIQCDNSMMAFELATNGNGLAMARSSLVEGMLKNKQLARAFDLSIPAREAFYLMEQGKEGSSNTHTAFREWLLDETQAFRNSDSTET